jgi:hypothetical protein
MLPMQGKFGFPANYSILHLIPPGESIDGCPVIIIPKEPAKVVMGRKYTWHLLPTRDATCIIDGLVYRVMHAIELQSPEEADIVDTIVHRTAGNNKKATLADALPGDIAGRLAALKAQLEAAP